jgi:sarcosine oxidase, subunit gamma
MPESPMLKQMRRNPVLLESGSYWRPEPPRARFSLRVDLGATAARATTELPLATTPCRAHQRGEWSALWLGPDEQLLIGPEDGAPAFAAAVAETLRGLNYSLVDIGHRQGALELTGPYAVALINSACPLDLRDAAAPVGFCSRTVFAKAEVVLWRRAEERWQLQAWRSFMPYVSGLLALAAREYPATAPD